MLFFLHSWLDQNSLLARRTNQSSLNALWLKRFKLFHTLTSSREPSQFRKHWSLSYNCQHYVRDPCATHHPIKCSSLPDFVPGNILSKPEISTKLIWTFSINLSVQSSKENTSVLTSCAAITKLLVEPWLPTCSLPLCFPMLRNAHSHPSA